MNRIGKGHDESRIIRNEGTGLRLTGQRAPITHLDALPFPDRSLVSYEKYQRYIGQAMVKFSISLHATRGCPYRCKYCNIIWPRKHVRRSAQNIFEEMKLYYELGIRRFVFVDDIFNLDIRESSRFFEMLIQRNMAVKIFFPAGLRGDILTEDYIDLIVEAGVTGFAIALESASPRLQALIEKNLDVDKVRRTAEYICDKHPQVILEFFTMHGFPTETQAEARDTLEFIKSLKWVHFPYLNLVRIYPNTGMEQLALENGVSAEAIRRAENLGWHELAETLPHDKSFTYQCQSELLHEYILNRDRLLHVLPFQMEILTEDEMVQKYDSYLPYDIKTLDDLYAVTGIAGEEIAGRQPLEESALTVSNLDEKIQGVSPVKEVKKDSFRILLLDLSHFFSGESRMLYDCVEAPLGLMALLSFLNRELGSAVTGKILTSRIDFDDFDELRKRIADFKPQLIGLRTLTFFRNQFHQTAAEIRGWGYAVPIIAGGPYATSDYQSVLADPNIDLVVLGEGEVTFRELVTAMLAAGGVLPHLEVLERIDGLALRIADSPVPAPTSAAEQVELLTWFNDDLENE